MTLNADEIKGYLRRNYGIDPQESPRFADQFYTCPTEEWFYGEFAEEVRRVWRGLRPPFWKRWFIPNKWDCDDFSRGAAWMAAVMHRGTNSPGAIAIGEYWYYRDANPTDEHAILVAVFSPVHIGFMEPQSGQNVRLRDDEKSTWYRF